MSFQTARPLTPNPEGGPLRLVGPGNPGKVVQQPAYGDIQVVDPVNGDVVWGFYTDEAPFFSGGYGGREPQPRPKKPSLTPWTGRSPFTLTLPMILSVGGDSVSGLIRTIHNFGTGNGETVSKSGKVTGDTEPTIVTVAARGLLFPDHASSRWSIEDVQWGALARREDFSTRLQLVTLILQEQPVGDILVQPTLGSIARGRVRHYTVTQADKSAHRGLPGIAAATLGDPDRWVDIAALNDLSQSSQLRVGMVLVLP